MAERNNLINSPDEPLEGRSAEEIKQDIAARRESISETVHRLNDKVQRSFDWREYVSDYPLVTVGVAVGAGMLLSGLFKRRLSPQDRIMAALSESVENIADRFRDQLDDLPIKKSGGLGKTVKTAATATVTNAVAKYLKQRFLIGSPQTSGLNRNNRSSASYGSDDDI